MDLRYSHDVTQIVNNNNQLVNEDKMINKSGKRPEDMTTSDIFKTYECIDTIQGINSDNTLYVLENCLGNKLKVDKHTLYKLQKDFGYNITNLTTRLSNNNPLIKQKKDSRIDTEVTKLAYIRKEKHEDIVEFSLMGLLLDLEKELKSNNLTMLFNEVTLTDAGTEDIRDITTRLRLLSSDSIIIDFPKYKAVIEVKEQDDEEKQSNTQLNTQSNTIINQFTQTHTIKVYIASAVKLLVNDGTVKAKRGSYATEQFYEGVCMGTLRIDNLDIINTDLSNVFNLYLKMDNSYAMKKFELCNMVLQCKNIYRLIGKMGITIDIHDIDLPECESIEKMIYDAHDTIVRAGNSTLNRIVIDSLTIENIRAPKVKTIKNLICGDSTTQYSQGIQIQSLNISNIQMDNIETIAHLVSNINIDIYNSSDREKNVINISNIHAPKCKQLSYIISHVGDIDNHVRKSTLVSFTNIHMPNLEILRNIISNSSLIALRYDGSIKGEKINTVERILDTVRIDEHSNFDEYSLSLRGELDLRFLNTEYNNLGVVREIIYNTIIYNIDLSNLDLSKVRVVENPIAGLIYNNIKLGTDLSNSIKHIVTPREQRKQAKQDEQRKQDSNSADEKQ